MENVKVLSKHPGAKPKSKRPSSRSYENLKVTVNNPFTVAKLQFFSFLACVLQPFLKSYETDDPMVPFLYNYIFSLLQQIIIVVVKNDLLINCKDFGGLMKLDLDKKNKFMEFKDMSIGFSTLSTITKLKGRLDEQRSNFIFLQWCFSICSKYYKKNQKKLRKAQWLTIWSAFSDLWSSHHVSGKRWNSTIKA